MDKNEQARLDRRLELAIHANLVDNCQTAINDGANPNVVDSTGNTMLHLAVLSDNDEIVRLLLQAGADTEARGERIDTPLLRAIRCNRATIVPLLLQAGADIHANMLGVPLAMVLEWAQPTQLNMVQMLDAAGMDVNAPDQHGRRALHNHVDNAETVGKLLDMGADPNVADHNGITPLHLAAGENSLEVIQLLIDRGARANIANRSGQRAWNISDHPGTISILRDMETQHDAEDEANRLSCDTVEASSPPRLAPRI